MICLRNKKTNFLLPTLMYRPDRALKHDHAEYFHLSYDVVSESEITPCNKTNKPLVVYRFTGNVLTSITKLRT